MDIQTVAWRLGHSSSTKNIFSFPGEQGPPGDRTNGWSL